MSKLTSHLEECFKANRPLAGLLAVYFAVAAYHFFRQGLVHFDEALFVVVVNTYSSIIHEALTNWRGLFGSGFLGQLMADYGNIYTSARPSYILPAVLADAFVPAQFVTRLLNLLAGAGTVIYFYRIQDFFSIDKTLKFFSTLLLIISPLFLMYGRIGLSQYLSAFLLLATVFHLLRFVDKGERRELKIASVFLSLLLMSHYNILPVVFLICVFVLFHLFKTKKPVSDYLTFASNFLFLPLVWEAITRLGVFLASYKNLVALGGDQRLYSYFQEVINQLSGVSSTKGFALDQPLYYFKLLFQTEGLVFSILLAAALFWILLNIRKIRYGYIFVLAYFFIVFFSLSYLKFPRNFVTILPLVYLSIPVALQHFLTTRRNSAKRIAPAILILVLVIGAGINYRNYRAIYGLKTNFQEIARWITKKYDKDSTLVLTSIPPVYRVYLPGYRVEGVYEPSSWQEQAKGKKNIIYVRDYTTTMNAYDLDVSGYRFKTVQEFEDNVHDLPPLILEYYYRSAADSQKMIDGTRGGRDKIIELSL
ncbi:hypothetical protein HGA34_00245 [Candidatus Falkowbacteria bacterium]|nr:hypothetical protein [Candidatus Falkowbacteria bacterium]